MDQLLSDANFKSSEDLAEEKDLAHYARVGSECV